MSQIDMLKALEEGARASAVQAPTNTVRNGWLDLARAAEQLKRRLVRHERDSQPVTAASALARPSRRPSPHLGRPLVAEG